MHLFFIIRMSGSWLTMSFILLYTNEVDGKALMSTGGSEEKSENFNIFQNQNQNYNYDGGKGMNHHDDIEGSSHVINSNRNFDNDNFSLRKRRRNHLDQQSKLSSNYIRDHLYPTGRRGGRPIPDYSQEDREEEDGENKDMLSDFQTSSLRSIDKIPEPIRTRFFDTQHQMKGSFQYTNFENEPIATPLVQRDISASENEHSRRHSKSHGRRNKEKRKESISNFLPRNDRRKQYCLKKIMRNIWKLNCKQYINLKRLNLINKNKIDLSDYEIKRQLKKCLALFRNS